MLATRTIPAALARTGGVVSANGPNTPEAMFNELTNTLTTGFTEYRDRMGNLEDALGAIQAQVNGGGASAIGGAGSILPVDAPYTQAFNTYFRNGAGEEFLRSANASGDRATVQAAMSVGTNSDGGYLAPVEWNRKLQERQRATSPMRRLATVQNTVVGAFTTLWNNDQFGSGWVGETAARPQTTNANLLPISFAAGEIYAMPTATQRLLDDAAINVETWLAQSIGREFNRQEGIAFLSGDGINKPRGLLTYGVGEAGAAAHPGGPVEVTTGAITVDTLTDYVYALGAPYRQNATWLMSSLTAAFIAKMKDANGLPIWRESLIVGQPATLLGRPVEIDEGMPPPTAGNLAIGFGDFAAGYLINDRNAVRILRDPFTNKPYINFYVTKRVGAGLLDPFALRFFRIA